MSKRKNSYLTVTDQFCGAGGSSLGIRNLATKNGGGLEVKLALNHWKLAIETHNTNFPNTDHVCTDIQACDPRWYPSTDILITSPECTNHSLAKGAKRKQQNQLNLFGGKIDEGAERSRATMWDVPRFAEVHNYNIIIVENVVDARYWRLWNAWLKAMHDLGYLHQCVYLNSMFCHPTPQSRDRMYVVFWKKGNKAPDLEYRPLAHCRDCGNLESYQSWKKPEKKWGKFKQQYIYRCSGCNKEVMPYYFAAFNCIDWSIKGEKIGDRKTPLSPKNIERIKAGLTKYGNQYFITTTGYSSGVDCRLRHVGEVLPTQPGDSRHGIVTPFIIKSEHTKADYDYTKSSLDPTMTQTTFQTMGVVVPLLVGNYSPGWSKDVNQPAGTVTTADHHGLVSMPMIVENFGTSFIRPVTDRLGCVTTANNYGIITTEQWQSFLASYYSASDILNHVSDTVPTVTTVDRTALVQMGENLKVEDYYYRMLKAHEIQKAMAFADDYIVCGNSREKVKQLGNAVTPPAMQWLAERAIESLA